MTRFLLIVWLAVPASAPERSSLILPSFESRAACDEAAAGRPHACVPYDPRVPDRQRPGDDWR